MLREVNDKPIRLKNVFIPNTDWRVHPEAASKSFRIEKRQGEKWTSIARFLVSVAACKPVEPAETRAPAPEATPPAPESAPSPAPRRNPPTLKKK